jgi:hypothetical protein
MKKKNWYLVTLFILLMALNKFFEYKPFQEFSGKVVYVLFIILLVFTFRRLSFKKGVFIGPIKYIFLSLVIAIIPSILFWDQGVFQSIAAIAPYSYFLLFFFLIEAKIKREYIIKIVLANAYIGLLLFVWQTINSSGVLFGYVEEFKLDRGVVRIVFPGEGFMFFALFYYLNKLGRRFKIKYIIALIAFLMMMLMQVTRIYILAFGLIAIYHFMVKSKVQYRVFGIMFFVAGYLFFFNTDNKIITEVRDQNQHDVETKDDYIRLLAADYYLFKFPKNEISYFLGNGAYYHNSSYGKKILSLNENERYYLEDLGLLKGYVLFGVLFVFGYILIFIKSFTVSTPYNQLYLKYYIWMILILSLTTRANTNAGFGVVMVTVLYLFEFAYLEQNNWNKTKNDTNKIDLLI